MRLLFQTFHIKFLTLYKIHIYLFISYNKVEHMSLAIKILEVYFTTRILRSLETPLNWTITEIPTSGIRIGSLSLFNLILVENKGTFQKMVSYKFWNWTESLFIKIFAENDFAYSGEPRCNIYRHSLSAISNRFTKVFEGDVFRHTTYSELF